MVEFQTIGVLGCGIWQQKPFSEGRVLIRKMIDASQKIGEEF